MAVADITQEDIKCTLFWYEWSVCKIQDSCEKLIGRSSKRKNVKASSCEKNYLLASSWEELYFEVCVKYK